MNNSIKVKAGAGDTSTKAITGAAASNSKTRIEAADSSRKARARGSGQQQLGQWPPVHDDSFVRPWGHPA